MQKIGTPGAASQNWAFLACALRRTKPPVRREKTSSSESSDTGLSGGICCSVNDIDECKAPAWWFLRADLAGRACVRALRACLAGSQGSRLGRHAREHCQQNNVGLTSALRIHAALHLQFECPRLRRRQMQPWHLDGQGRKGRLLKRDVAFGKLHANLKTKPPSRPPADNVSVVPGAAYSTGGGTGPAVSAVCQASAATGTY